MADTATCKECGKPIRADMTLPDGRTKWAHYEWHPPAHLAQPREMLRCETNTRTMEERVLKAFRASALYPTCRGGHGRIKLVRHRVYADFEHGQWFITCLPCGAQWSVNDLAGGPSIISFSFEQVSKGEGD